LNQKFWGKCVGFFKFFPLQKNIITSFLFFSFWVNNKYFFADWFLTRTFHRRRACCIIFWFNRNPDVADHFHRPNSVRCCSKKYSTNGYPNRRHWSVLHDTSNIFERWPHQSMCLVTNVCVQHWRWNDFRWKSAFSTPTKGAFNVGIKLQLSFGIRYDTCKSCIPFWTTVLYFCLIIHQLWVKHWFRSSANTNFQANVRRHRL
jgi:hypothetical protein